MASISGMLSAITASKPKPTRLTKPAPSRWVGSGGCRGLVVECSSRPKKKATSHHMKTRPKKTQPWDVRRKGPTLYPPLPPLPSDWTLVSSSSSELGDPQPTIQQAAELEPAT